MLLALLIAACTPSGGPPTEPAATTPAASPATPEPLPVEVDRRVSVGREPFGDIDLWLELGARTVGDVDALLRTTAALPDPGARVVALADAFRDTPFEYESQLPTPAPDVLRVQLRSFDCTTFVYTLAAMASARSFEEFVLHLRDLRYLDGRAHIDADPTDGNVLDYPYDVLVHNGVAQGYVRDVTAEVAGEHPLTRFASRPAPHRRAPAYDTEERLIAPRLNPGEVVSAQLLARADIDAAAEARVHDGDLLLFSRLDPAAPVGDGLLVGHLAVARVVDGVLTLAHATRDYRWRPGAGWATPPTGTGIFYADDPRREQLGVSLAGTWVDDPDGRQLRIGAEPYYGYDLSRPRPLRDYMDGAHVRGVLVLRPTDPSAEHRAAERAYLAALPARTGGDAPVTVTSAMTDTQAIRDGLDPECPEDVAAAQRLVPVEYRGFDGALHRGQVVVNRRVASEVRQLFAILRETGVPLRSVTPISDPAYGWSDARSMAADNTSGFNWRNVPDTTVLSRHACGLAIDVNPRTNPFVRTRNGLPWIEPPGAVYDPHATGALYAEHPAVRKLTRLGWTWGGRWTSLKDWQHFETGTCERP